VWHSRAKSPFLVLSLLHVRLLEPSSDWKTSWNRKTQADIRVLAETGPEWNPNSRPGLYTSSGPWKNARPPRIKRGRGGEFEFQTYSPPPLSLPPPPPHTYSGEQSSRPQPPLHPPKRCDGLLWRRSRPRRGIGRWELTATPPRVPHRGGAAEARIKLEIVELDADEEWSSSTPASMQSASETLRHTRLAARTGH
jgi:hypothetical protein